ncbi:Cellulose synthase 1 [Providencia manganoxydans]|uniref:cellulose biosynthesis cyclic di-GMP-binding regulatory protein BcsB n=1 Tax=Providencia manganoxydans TaxID=2923283 RepID=UPI003B9979F0
MPSRYMSLLLIISMLLMQSITAFAQQLESEYTKLSTDLDFILNNNLSDNKNNVETTSEEISLKKLGLTKGLTLTSSKLQSGVSFTLPYDFIAINSDMRIVISVNQADNIEKENLQVILNGQSLGAVPLSQVDENRSIFTLKIPNSLLSSKNNLNFQVISNDDIINNEWTCQRPDLKNLVVKIAPSSSMTMKGILMNTRKSLADFPRPFLDPLKINRNELTFIYSASPTSDSLVSSAIVASIFGIKSDEKENDFNVYFDEIPEKHAILFTTLGETISGQSFADPNGSSLKLIDNPNNKKYKLLVVSGRNTDELRQAAYQLFRTDLTDNSTMQVQPHTVHKRQAYDAPNWLSDKKIIPFSQLIKSPDALQAHMFWNEEKKINFRLPPDMFMLSGDKIPLKIDYTFDRKNWFDVDNSMLTIALNQQFLKNVNAKNHTIVAPIIDFFESQSNNSTTLYLDNTRFQGENKLSFYFNITPNSDTPCNILSNNDIVNQILPSSTLDLRNIGHFGELPNSAWFLSGLFPFTKYADLSDTSILVPEQPEKDEVALLLNLMEHSGRITGFPVRNLTLFNHFEKIQSNSKLKSSNIIIINKLKDFSAIQPLLSDTPYHYNQGNLQISSPSLIHKTKLLLLGEWKNQFEEANNFLLNTHQWRGSLSFKSPWSSDKIVTILTATNSAQLNKLATDMITPGRQQIESGDTLLFSDLDDVKILRLTPSFLSGELPLFTLTIWFFSQHLFLLMTILFGSLFLISFYLFQRLKAHESKRLSGTKK